MLQNLYLLFLGGKSSLGTFNDSIDLKMGNARVVISGNRICRNPWLFLQFDVSFLPWPCFEIHLVYLHWEPLCLYIDQGIQSKIDLKDVHISTIITPYVNMSLTIR